MIDTSAILDQVVSHLNVIVDDGFQQRGPQVFVLGIHLRTSLPGYNQMQFLISGTKYRHKIMSSMLLSCGYLDHSLLYQTGAHLYKHVADFQQTSLSCSM